MPSKDKSRFLTDESLLPRQYTLTPRPSRGSSDHSLGRATAVTRPARINEEFLNRTRALWSAKLNRPVTSEEAKIFIRDFVGIFDVLAEWSDPPASPDVSDSQS